MKRVFEHKPVAPSDEEQSPSGHVPLQSAVAAALNDESTRRLGALLGEAQAVAPVRYTRERHGPWLVEHGRAGNDYIFQLHPRKPPSRPWQDIVTAFIAAMDSIFPRTVPTRYCRPDEQWQVKFFTIQLETVCQLPGWEQACARAAKALAEVRP